MCQKVSLMCQKVINAKGSKTVNSVNWLIITMPLAEQVLNWSRTRVVKYASSQVREVSVVEYARSQ